MKYSPFFFFILIQIVSDSNPFKKIWIRIRFTVVANVSVKYVVAEETMTKLMQVMNTNCHIISVFQWSLLVKLWDTSCILFNNKK